MKLEGSPRMYKFVVLKLSVDDGGLLAAGLDVVPAAGEYCCCCCCCCYRTNHQRVIAAGFPWDIVHTYIIFINRGGSGVQSLLGGWGVLVIWILLPAHWHCRCCTGRCPRCIVEQRWTG